VQLNHSLVVVQEDQAVEVEVADAVEMEFSRLEKSVMSYEPLGVYHVRSISRQLQEPTVSLISGWLYQYSQELSVLAILGSTELQGR
jgi:hypothetical protein